MKIFSISRKFITSISSVSVLRLKIKLPSTNKHVWQTKRILSLMVTLMLLYFVIRTTRRSASLISFGASQSPITGMNFARVDDVGTCNGDENDRRSTYNIVPIRRAVNASTLTSYSLHSDYHILYTDRNNGNVTSTRDGRDTSNRRISECINIHFRLNDWDRNQNSEFC